MADSLVALGLGAWLSEQSERLGIRQPTPVQQHCIPAILR
ncbi:hypothetical protein chiPu_0023972, partial [Chiloscyllium punctatum]|nr:hypothetical protein [Chiloscyllium punctatum]